MTACLRCTVTGMAYGIQSSTSLLVPRTQRRISNGRSVRSILLCFLRKLVLCEKLRAVAVLPNTPILCPSSFLGMHASPNRISYSTVSDVMGVDDKVVRLTTLSDQAPPAIGAAPSTATRTWPLLLRHATLWHRQTRRKIAGPKHASYSTCQLHSVTRAVRALYSDCVWSSCHPNEICSLVLHRITIRSTDP